MTFLSDYSRETPVHFIKACEMQIFVSRNGARWALSRTMHQTHNYIYDLSIARLGYFYQHFINRELFENALSRAKTLSTAEGIFISRKVTINTTVITSFVFLTCLVTVYSRLSSTFREMCIYCSRNFQQ